MLRNMKKIVGRYAYVAYQRLNRLTFGDETGQQSNCLQAANAIVFKDNLLQ